MKQLHLYSIKLKVENLIGNREVKIVAYDKKEALTLICDHFHNLKKHVYIIDIEVIRKNKKNEKYITLKRYFDECDLIYLFNSDLEKFRKANYEKEN